MSDQDNSRTRAASAWWINPESGEIIAVEAHVLTLLSMPEHFGLTAQHIRQAGAHQKSLSPINHLDRDPDSPRVRLIALAVAHGWVRLRAIRGGPLLIQVTDGDLARAGVAVAALVGSGVRTAAQWRIIDPERGIDRLLPAPRAGRRRAGVQPPRSQTT